MANKYEEVARILNDMASVKMAMNSHKGKIEDIHPDEAVAMLQGELDELAEACNGSDLMHVIEEAADIQNFLLALVHQQLAKYRSRK
tara:strand:- start:3730 stop:3990 length:261 start_codon:yes stop_codon:yes gene_type:complete